MLPGERLPIGCPPPTTTEAHAHARRDHIKARPWGAASCEAVRPSHKHTHRNSPGSFRSRPRQGQAEGGWLLRAGSMCVVEGPTWLAVIGRCCARAPPPNFLPSGSVGSRCAALESDEDLWSHLIAFVCRIYTACTVTYGYRLPYYSCMRHGMRACAGHARLSLEISKGSMIKEGRSTIERRSAGSVERHWSIAARTVVSQRCKSRSWTRHETAD